MTGENGEESGGGVIDGGVSAPGQGPAERPTGPYALFNSAMAMLDRGQHDRARRMLNDCAAAGDREWSPRAAAMLGEMLWADGDADGAKRALSTAIGHRHPEWTPPAALTMGVVLTAQGDDEGALTYYRSVLDSGHPRHVPVAAFNMGLVLAGRGDVDGAAAAYRQAVGSRHSDMAPRAAVNLGVLLSRTGRTADALEAFRFAADSGHPEQAALAVRNIAAMQASPAARPPAPRPGGQEWPPRTAPADALDPRTGPQQRPEVPEWAREASEPPQTGPIPRFAAPAHPTGPQDRPQPPASARPDRASYDTGSQPRYETGPQPRYDTGPQSQPRYDTGPQPRPRYDTGPQPRYDTGPQPRYDTGPQPQPRYETGPQSRPPDRPTFDTGGQPRHETGPQPRYDTGPQPRPSHQTSYDTGPHPRDTGPRPRPDAAPRVDWVQSPAGPSPDRPADPAARARVEKVQLRGEQLLTRLLNPADAAGVEAQHDVCVWLIELADVQVTAGDYNDALENLSSAHELAHGLVMEVPDDGGYLRNEAQSATRAGDLCRRLHRPDEALAWYGRAHQASLKLSEAERDNSDGPAFVGLICLRAAQAEKELGRSGETVAALREAVAWLTAGIEREPGRSDVADQLGVALWRLAVEVPGARPDAPGQVLATLQEVESAGELSADGAEALAWARSQRY